MGKYLKMIPVMLYPYAYLPALVVFFSTPVESNNVDIVYEGIFVYAIVLHILVLAIAIYNSIATGRGVYDLQAATKINMLTKLIQIPAYVFHFVLGCLGALMSIWGIGIILFVLVVDLISIMITGISAIGCSIIMNKSNVISKQYAIIGGICSFVFCVDVVVAVMYYLKVRKTKDNASCAD